MHQQTLFHRGSSLIAQRSSRSLMLEVLRARSHYGRDSTVVAKPHLSAPAFRQDAMLLGR